MASTRVAAANDGAAQEGLQSLVASEIASVTTQLRADWRAAAAACALSLAAFRTQAPTKVARATADSSFS